MKRKLLFTIVALLLVSPVILAQFVTNVSKKGTTAAPFLNIGQSARAISMGSAFVGVSDDASAMYWNPSGIAKLPGINVMFDHTNWIADIKYNFIAATYNLGDMGTVGVSFTTSDIGEMKVTTVDEPNGTGETFTATDAAFSIAYAINLTDNFSIGFNPKFIHQSIWRMSATAFALDLGIQYKTPFDGMILAMSISNFGTKMQLLGNSNLVLHDLNLQSTGNNGRIPAYLETGQWALPLNFRVGVAYNPVFTDEHKITVAVDAAHPNDDYESVNIGAEYVFKDFIAFRGGYKSMFLEDSEESFSLGFGLKQFFLGNIALKLDYAYQDFGRLSDIQKFTVGISF
ncbi:MAG: PorV/PorQ family protein [Ignavibacteriales bacterium]|nr:MAG: PorV/PorQ family protein [Ignavibacteriales bacterium]